MALSENDSVTMNGMNLPAFRTSLAVERGVEKNLLISTWGGIGDQICAEPTLRFALRTFKGCKISLASEHPDLFAHLKFDTVFDLRQVQPIWKNYLLFDTIRNQTSDDLLTMFVSHMLTNCVDYPSICAFRCMLPIADKEIQLVPSYKDERHVKEFVPDSILYNSVAIHCGRHWQSKTFPADWWNRVIKTVLRKGGIPILIGADTDDNRGTVEVDTDGCLDFRNEFSVMQTVSLLQRIRVLLTNDSSPLHMAASGDAWIGLVATSKHPDYIMHWRRGQWAWREVNFSKGNISDVMDYCPNVTQEKSAENVGDSLFEWLPDPGDFGRWGVEKLGEDAV